MRRDCRHVGKNEENLANGDCVSGTHPLSPCSMESCIVCCNSPMQGESEFMSTQNMIVIAILASDSIAQMESRL